MENKQAVKQLKALRTFHNQFIEDNKLLRKFIF